MAAISRRTLLGGAVALGAAGGLAGLADLVTGDRPTARSGPSAAGGGVLRIGYLPITDASPLLVAHAQGRFDRAGVRAVRPVLFRGWESLAQAFVAGELDVVHLLMPFAVQLRYALGAQVRVLAWNHTNGSALTVGPRVRDLSDLAGTTVAIPFWWSIHNVMLQRMLREAGLRAVVRDAPSAVDRTVRLVVLSPADMLPALHTGTISGYIVADPFNAAAEIRKVGRIARFVGDAWRQHACCVVVARQDLIDSAPEVVQGVTDALTGAQQWVDGHRPETAGLLSGGKYLPQPQPAITRALTYDPSHYAATLQNPDWGGQRIGFAPFPFPTYTAALVDAMRDTVVDGDTTFLQGLDGAHVHADLVDDRFVRSSITALGGPGAFGLPADLTRTEELART
ncbi:ABC transporter substrate-binding protein [Pseudonocardia endophytica]|uniref:NitT/TauT family transport system substrate-binding protein n=1 Tax=Pseudonocardia endophytica TaxID=401976 RepID=A0A4R1HWY3_PSEEN|nr:ABC transporter substrate-binding protein [Pseudonocardia endophytica]TCK22052.1 NitT/TauT family transport system substrate-binding protein [Pseudonocardia endophytica]